MGTQVRIKGVPLDSEKTYKVLTSNLLTDGDDGFLLFKPNSLYKNTGIQILDSMDQIQRLPSERNSN